MTQLIELSKTETMSSREIAELTGKQHSNVMVDVRNLIDQLGNEPELFFQLGSYFDANNQERPQYNLTKKETLLLVSGYSAILRLKIINRWEQLENANKQPLPSNYIDALKALIEKEEEKLLLNQKVDNLETALDSLVAWVSIIKVSQHNKVKENQFQWPKLKAKSVEMGYLIKKAESSRYDYQNLYHVNVFKAVYPQYNYNFLNK